MMLVAVAVIVLAAIALRLWGISLESLDGDEVFSYRVVSSHFSAAMTTIRNDLVHPPLYYFLLRGWLDIAGHASPLALRAVSLISGISTVALLACMGWMFPQIRTAALIAAGLLAANDLHIFYSQQARSYAFFAFVFTCLLTWSWQITRFMQQFAFWCCGVILMSLLVYTHYVGSVYVACIIIAVTISPVPKRAKLRIWIAGFVAACSFIPWILAEIGPARQHHGTEDNLSWESLPTVYDLKAIWASYLGIPAFHAATTCVFLIGCILVGFSIFHRRREQNRFRRVFLMTLAFTAFVPPCLLFVLSMKPISLHIFGARHLLPSITSYLLLAADGLVQISKYFRTRTIALSLGAAVLFALELVPTAAATRSGPRRMPFRAIASAAQGKLPIYTTWPYGIGAVMNFYEHDHSAVRSVPRDLNSLPDSFVLIFRPGIRKEEEEFENLLKLRWQDERNRDFYNGERAGYYVRVAYLQRADLAGGGHAAHPLQILPKRTALQPDKAKERFTVDRVSRYSGIRLDSPAQIGGIPRLKAIAARRHPQKAEHQGCVSGTTAATEAGFDCSISGVA